MIRLARPALSLLLLALLGCGGGEGAGEPDAAQAQDVPTETAGPDATEDVTTQQDTGADADDDGVPTTPGGLPLALPFEFERPDVGTPLTDEEVATFTRRITGLLAQMDYYTWVYETTHGTDASTGLPGYLIWWHDVEAVKTGDLVTFVNNKEDGGSHNNAVPTMLALAQAIGGYMSSGDAAAAALVEQLTRSIHAVTLGFVHDEDDPIDFLMARNIITQNHEFVLPSGKQKAVDYTEWYFPYEGWNADRFRYEHNPTWGDIWVTNKRSKDDVPYFFRVAAWLPYVAELAPDPEVREVAAEALDLLERFAADIVDQGYLIRTKDAEGNPVFVDDQDLDSFVNYVGVFPDAECDARLGSALLGHGEPLDVDCGDGQGSPYDRIAGSGHFFNYDIIVHFHIAAIPLALVRGHADVARDLLGGLVTRLEGYRDPDTEEPGREDAAWEKEITHWLITSASVGYPLTSDEARQIHDLYLRTIDDFEEFPRWDLWDPSVADGVYNFRDGGLYPEHRDDRIDIEYIAFVLEYCWSPFRNPAGATFVDCDVVRDPTRWGE
ncbi:MAG: hypothetical protein ACQEXJ_05770 [Myxococcota bacterium]